MDYTSEELRLEEKRNIEIIESCQSAIDEIDEHLDNIDDLIAKIVNQGDILAQIAAVDEKMEAIDKVHAFLSKDDENTRNKLLEEKKRLSEMKTLLMLNEKGNENELQMLERKKQELEIQKGIIKEEQHKADKILGNIIAICDEYVDELDNEIKGKKTKQIQNSAQFSEMIEKYAKIEEELEEYKLYDGFLTKKQKARIKEMEDEKFFLNRKLSSVIPDFNEVLKDKANAIKLDLQFGISEIQNEREINRKTTIMTSYKKVAEEIQKYRNGNPIVEKVDEKEPEEKTPVEKTTEAIPTEFKILEDAEAIKKNDSENTSIMDLYKESMAKKEPENTPELEEQPEVSEPEKETTSELEAVAFDAPIDVFEAAIQGKPVNKKEPEIEASEPEIEPEKTEDEIALNDYLNELRKGSREEKIDKKIKRRVSLAMKLDRIKRVGDKIYNGIYNKVKNFIFEPKENEEEISIGGRKK